MKKFVKMLTWTISCLVFAQTGFVSAKIFPDKKCCPLNKYFIETENGIQCGVPYTMKNRLEMPFIDDESFKPKNKTNPMICDRKLNNGIDFINCTDLYFNDELMSISHVAIKCVNRGNTSYSKILTIVNSEDEHDPKIYFMNICCPLYQAYDYEKRLCVNKRKDLSGLVQTLGEQTNFVNFRRPVEQCKTVLADYQFSNFAIHDNIIAIGGSYKYKVNLNKNITDWCIDALADNPNQFIFKVCENDKYCDKHMCLKKCTDSDKNLKLNDFDEYESSPMVVSLHDALKKITSDKFSGVKRLILNSIDLGFKPYLKCPYGYQEIVPSWEMTALGHLKLIIKNAILLNDHYCIDVVIDDKGDSDVQVFTCYNISLENAKGFSMFDYRLIVITLAFFILAMFLSVLIFDSYLFDKLKPTT